MEVTGDVVTIRPFVALTTAIIVLFIGKALNRRFVLLRRLNISDSVSGGLLVSLVLAAVYALTRVEVVFDLSARQYLVVYFFTTIGLNTRLPQLLAARRLLLSLLLAAVAFMVIQDGLAVGLSSLFGEARPEALLAGTIALVGGSETVLAWAPVLDESYGVAGAKEIGLAAASLGVILASLSGGPIAAYLIARHRLGAGHSSLSDREAGEGVHGGMVDPLGFLRAILAIHVCIILGVIVNQVLADRDLELPFAVTCFLVAILVTNLVPVLLPKLDWPSRTPATWLIAELTLGILFGMTLISGRIWAIFALPPGLLAIVVVQLAVTIAFAIVLVFRIMGRDYDAAVLCAGFTGFALGSTSTAMASMKAVARSSGTAHLGFIILPLVTLLCVDAVNWALVKAILAGF